MIWTVRWSPLCDVDVRHIAWARDGFVEDLDPVGHDGADLEVLFRLRVRGGFALVRIDESTMTLDVSRILPDKPARRIVPLL